MGLVVYLPGVGHISVSWRRAAHPDVTASTLRLPSGVEVDFCLGYRLWATRGRGEEREKSEGERNGEEESKNESGGVRGTGARGEEGGGGAEGKRQGQGWAGDDQHQTNNKLLSHT